MGVTYSGLACAAEPTRSRSRTNPEPNALVGVHGVSGVVGGAIARADVGAVKVLTCRVTIRSGERRCRSATCHFPIVLWDACWRGQAPRDSATRRSQ